MSRLSRRVSQLAPSQTMALAARAAALKAAGHPVINYSVGEPDFGSPEVAAEEAAAAIQRGETKYTPAPGSKALREAVRRKVARDYAWSGCEVDDVARA